MAYRSPTSSARLPALDGLRGFALIGMLAWHAEVTWVRGGFARMTIFFVLAGFLAALSLARARESGGRFWAFWGRRARRLLPMTLVGVAFAIATTALVGGAQARASLRGDAIATLASMANWRFVRSEQPYAALFESGSAFQHYWSLSLEEQAFLLLPAVLGVVAWCTRGHRVARLWVLGGLGLACGLLPAVVSMAPDTVYYGTHVRFGEFLVGVVLAEVLLGVDHQAIARRTRRLVGAAGAIGLAVLVLTMVGIDREQSWLYQGGLWLFAVPTAAVIAAVWMGTPTVRTVLAIAPLAVLGRAALSIYVLHWPLYLLLADGWTGLSGTTLVVIQLGSAVALGLLAFRFLEEPLLRVTRARSTDLAPGSTSRGRRLLRERPAYLLVPVMAVLVAAAVAVPPSTSAIDFEAALADQQELGVDEAMALLDERDPVQIPLSRDPSLAGVALFGGSAALMLGLGAGTWADPHDRVEHVHGYARLGCGLITGGSHRAIGTPQATGSFAPQPDDCRDWEVLWPATVVRNAVDVAVVFASTWDLSEWRFGGGPVVGMGVGWFDDLLRERLGVAADLLHDAGASEVVFLTPLPPPDLGSADERERMRRAGMSYRAMLVDIERERPWVRVVDLGRWVDGLDPDEVDRLLPDGIHATPATAGEIWRDFLGPALERATTTVPVRV